MIESTLMSLQASPSMMMNALEELQPDMKPKARSASRCLFGRPDPIATNKWLRDRLNEQQEEQNKFWNFDFANDCPLGSGGRFTFTPVAECDVPAFYRSKTIGGARRRRSAEENEAPLIALDCSVIAASSSTSSSSVVSSLSLSSSIDSEMSGALQLEAGRVGSTTATPAVVKRQSKITAFTNVRKRRAHVRLPYSSSSSSSNASSCHSAGQKRARVEEPASLQ